LVIVLSLIKSPNLPFNSAAQAELAVSYIMLGWWYATLVQMPLGKQPLVVLCVVPDIRMVLAQAEVLVVYVNVEGIWPTAALLHAACICHNLALVLGPSAHGAYTRSCLAVAC
jgi:hypothetical protein